ncbi:MAG: methyltransferase [Pseudomonadota bacterium]
MQDVTAAQPRLAANPTAESRATPQRPAPRPSLSERWVFLRNRLLRSARFQRFASAFPLTRPVATARAQEVFDLCAGFVYSQILSAHVSLGLLDVLADDARTFDELAALTGLDDEAARCLLNGGVAIKLLERLPGDRFTLGARGAALSCNAAALAMVRHHALLYDDLRDPLALLSGESQATRLATYWGYAANDEAAKLSPDQTAGYTELMADTQPMVAEEVIAAYDLTQHACLMDVGGGNGAFVRAAAGAAPDLQLLVFDLPSVAAQARDKLKAAGLGHRARALGGSFFDDPLPRDADAISLVRILLDHDDAHALRILQACHAALPPGGTLLIAEQMAETRGAEAMGDAYFGFYLFAMGKGRPRTSERLQQLVREAGFDAVRQQRTNRPMLTGLLVARKAA